MHAEIYIAELWVSRSKYHPWGYTCFRHPLWTSCKRVLLIFSSDIFLISSYPRKRSTYLLIFISRDTKVFIDKVQGLLIVWRIPLFCIDIELFRKRFWSKTQIICQRLELYVSTCKSIEFVTIFSNYQHPFVVNPIWVVVVTVLLMDLLNFKNIKRYFIRPISNITLLN